jgi:hypothetical protein
MRVNYYGLTPIAFRFQASACPPLADNFIYGLSPVVLRRKNKTVLSELAPSVKSKFIYEYDFGDSWEHLIEVVKIGPSEEDVKYPVCLAGELACPPEDCGGLWGYYEKLEILKNPKHEEYEDILGWMGSGFKPERFNLEKINAQLATLRKGKKRSAWEPY